MKKLVLGFAILMASVSMAYASTDEKKKDCTKCTTEQNCTEKKDCKDCDGKCGCKAVKKGNKGHKAMNGQKGKGGREAFKGGKGNRPERRFSEFRAFEGVNLTEEQKTKIDALRDGFKRDNEKVKAGMREDRKKAMEAAKAKAAEEKAKFDKELKSILSAEQYKKYTENTTKIVRK